MLNCFGCCEGIGQVDPSSVDAETRALFETWTPAQIGAIKGNAQPRPRFIELADLLDQYNNGLGDLGPDHCD